MKTVCVLLLFVALAAPGFAQAPDDKLIVPGQRIGKWNAYAQTVDEIAVHRQWIEAISRGDVDGAMRLVAEDMVLDDGGACGWPLMCVGLEEIRPQLEVLIRARSQLHVTSARSFATSGARWTTAWLEIRSELTRAAGVERTLAATTVALRGDRIASVTWRPNRGDAQTEKFLAAQPRSVPPTPPRAVPAPHGRFVDVADRKMYLECLGKGSPTVVFEAGLDPIGGASGKTWVGVAIETRPRPNRNIHGAVAGVTRACAYDRAGIGLSDRGRTPRDGLKAIGDLRTLLRAAGEEPPYVLVGWSLGAPLSYIFASVYRDQVAGLVLLDTAVDVFGFNGRWWEMMPVDAAERDRQQTEQTYAIIDSPGFLEGGWDLYALTGHVRGAPALPQVPVIVLTAGIPRTNPYDVWPASFLGLRPGWPPELIEKWWQLRLEIQRDLAQRVPKGRHIIVDSSHHFMQRFVPDQVTSAILGVVRAVRRETN